MEKLLETISWQQVVGRGTSMGGVGKLLNVTAINGRQLQGAVGGSRVARR